MGDRRVRSLDSQIGRLPAPYLNPWNSLGRAIHSVVVDLFLRISRLWRLNLQGDLPRPTFWSRQYGAYFWPFLLVATLLLCGFVLYGLHFSWLPRNSFSEINQSKQEVVVQGEITSIDETSSLDLDKIDQSDQIVVDSDLNNGTEPYELFDYSQELLPLSPLLDEVRKKGFPDGLIRAIQPKMEDELIAIELSSKWSKLSFRKKKVLVNQLQSYSEQLGYDELRLIDENRSLLARQSRVGQGMIIFNQE